MRSENNIPYNETADRGVQPAMEQEFPLIYSELFAIAKKVRFNFHGMDTMNTTAIIHEAYLKLSKGNNQWENQTHFYAVAAKSMRQIMINAARDKQRVKRGSGLVPDRLHEVGEKIVLSTAASEKLIDFEELLSNLEKKDRIYGSIVECRFYSGLSIAETAEALKVSPATVKRKWQLARDWLYVNLPEFNLT
jgi:RNA polymerase sigma factor (TIGR02999 family)